MKRQKYLVLGLAVLAFCLNRVVAQTELEICSNIAYYSAEELENADEYKRDHCKLDIKYPKNTPGFATVVWFHGGGLKAGRRGFVTLKDEKIAIVGVSYRLAYKAEHPAYLEDAGAATAWVIKNIAQYGGDTNKVFVSGSSGGAYLAAMIGMDSRWLAKHGVSNLQLAGIAPISGQMATHFTVKKVMGDTGPELRPIIDEFAPIYHCASNLPPICLIVGDRRIEYKNRVEENELMAVALKNLGHPRVEFYEMGGLNHGGTSEGGPILLRKFIQSIIGKKK